MKKATYLLIGLIMSIYMAHNAYAAITQDAPGDAVQISTDTGEPTFDNFNPSSNVDMSGAIDTDGTEFAIGAFHSMVDEKKSGKQFGMASDASSIFWLDISSTPAEGVDTTNSGAFGSTWTKM